MKLEDFKKEYAKKDVEIKGVRFTISKLPAIKGAVLFTDILKRIFKDISTVDVEDGNNVKNLLVSAISSLDPEYLESELMPKLFSYVSYSRETPKLKNLNLHETMDTVERYLEFDDILELMFRCIVVNFISAIFARISKYQTKQQ